MALLWQSAGCRTVGGGGYIGRNEFELLTRRVEDLETAVKPMVPAGSLPRAISRPTVSWETDGRRPGAGGPSVFESAGLGAESGAAGKSARAAADAGGAGENSLYQQGQSLLKQKKYDQAGAVFTQMLARDPHGKLAPNARYWLGECHYASGRYGRAAAEFQRCAEDYPRSAKAPDALLKLSYSHDRLGDGPRAMAVMDRLLTLYPDSSAAGLITSGQGRFSG